MKYDVYRWDSVGEAFSYRDAYKKTSFTATSDTYTYSDDTSFQSNGATYYRVVRAAEQEDAALLDVVHVVEALVGADRVLAAVAARVVLCPAPA